MQPRKTFFDPSEGYFIKMADLVDFSKEDREDTELINSCLRKISRMGGGTLYFSDGIYRTRTVMLQSNVTIYIDKSAVLKAAPGEYEHEDLIDPMTGDLYPWTRTHDAGHNWFMNSMFYAENKKNIKIIGNGKIDGDGFITKYDNINQDKALIPMDNKSAKTKSTAAGMGGDMPEPGPDSKGRTCNKMFAMIRCKNVEIGGICPSKDLAYDGDFEGKRGKVAYLNDDGSYDYESVDQMLHLTDTGHFVLVGSGIDGLQLHDLFLDNAPNMRDTFNLQGCNDVVCCNIFIEGVSDDVIKFASDRGMGNEYRDCSNFIARNIIGDTECNLILICACHGSIENVCIDNVIGLASNKAAICIAATGTSNARNVHINCGGSVGKCTCGADHGDLTIGYEPAKIHPYRSHITHMRMPFNISLGGFRDEPFNRIENIYIGKITCDKVYAGSRAKACLVTDFPEYEGRSESTSLIQGAFSANDPKVLADPGFGRVSNVVFEDVDLLVKGGHSEQERLNVIDPSVAAIPLRDSDNPDGTSRVPAYGFYIRHADGVHFKNCTIATEKYDGRHPFHADDSTDVTFENGNIYNPMPEK